ncbi:MAG: hypothetical protein MHPSP_000702, partial [Paramarteilia canceri]
MISNVFDSSNGIDPHPADKMELFLKMFEVHGFIKGLQCDANEFLSIVLDSCHEEVLNYNSNKEINNFLNSDSSSGSNLADGNSSEDSEEWVVNLPKSATIKNVKNERYDSFSDSLFSKVFYGRLADYTKDNLRFNRVITPFSLLLVDLK